MNKTESMAGSAIGDVLIMTESIKIILTLFCVFLLIFVGYYLYSYSQRLKVKEAVVNGLIVIDQENHDWNIDDKPVKVDIFVRNKSTYQVNGALVFSVTLRGKGLEKRFIDLVINKFGKVNFSELGTNSPRSVAIQNYINRGSVLALGQEYEPINNQEKDADYKISFRKYITLLPGESMRFVQDLEVPPKKQGYIFDIAISGIEF